MEEGAAENDEAAGETPCPWQPSQRKGEKSVKNLTTYMSPKRGKMMVSMALLHCFAFFCALDFSKTNFSKM